MPELTHFPSAGCKATREKLGAYLDGELDRRAHNEVQAHLAACAACRDELEELRQLSHLLRAAPQPDFSPARDFKAQLMLLLPRPAAPREGPAGQPGSRLLPWLAPALVLAGWVFIQAAMGLFSLASFANLSGILGGAAAWVTGGVQQMPWFTLAQTTFGGLLSPQGQVGLAALNDVGLFVQNTAIFLLWQVGVAALYWSILALAWHDQVKGLWNTLTEG